MRLLVPQLVLSHVNPAVQKCIFVSYYRIFEAACLRRDGRYSIMEVCPMGITRYLDLMTQGCPQACLLLSKCK